MKAVGRESLREMIMSFTGELNHYYFCIGVLFSQISLRFVIFGSRPILSYLGPATMMP